jgi:flagellar biosynthetic protein FlhB
VADKSQKTEEPTAKRKKEARERGQIARSPELVTWGALLAMTVLIELTVSTAVPRMRDLWYETMNVVAQPDQGKALTVLGDGMVAFLVSILPITLGLLVLGVSGNLAQVGLTPSAKRLKPDFKRLNVWRGLRQLFSVKSVWETIKAFAKVVVIFLVSFPLMQHTAHLIATSGGSPTETIRLTADGAITMIRNAALAGLVIAAVDYVIQRRRIHRELRMTRQEIKDEYRQQEGNPQMKQAIRSRQMRVSRNRMLAAVSTADVVLVNPTHYSVALKYDTERGAPEVVAKGAGEFAAGIRKRAVEHGVPIVSDPPLTRTIYKACEVGHMIPVELYEAVAKVLAYIFSLRRKGLARLGGVHTVPADLSRALAS